MFNKAVFRTSLTSTGLMKLSFHLKYQLYYAYMDMARVNYVKLTIILMSETNKHWFCHGLKTKKKPSEIVKAFFSSLLP